MGYMFFNEKFCDIDFMSIPIDNKLLEDVRKIVDTKFSRTTSDYLNMTDDEYRQVVASAQTQINDLSFVQTFSSLVYDQVSQVIGAPFLVQTNGYLRATRPVDAVQESIGYHREVFYGEPCMKYGYNVWIPIKNVHEDNSLYYIPQSQHIPTEDIGLEIIQEEKSGVARHSQGHKIGLLYSPKKIVSGVDLSSPKRLLVEEGCFSLFPAELIHGSAVNNTEDIRFSIDFRIIPEKYLKSNKDAHFSSGKSYFEHVNERAF